LVQIFRGAVSGANPTRKRCEQIVEQYPIGDGQVVERTPLAEVDVPRANPKGERAGLFSSRLCRGVVVSGANELDDKKGR